MTDDSRLPKPLQEYPPFTALIVDVLLGLGVVFKVTAPESQPVQELEE